MTDEEEAKRMAESQLVEAVARVLKEHPLVPFTHDAALTLARAAIAVIRPAVLEDAAKVAEHWVHTPADRSPGWMPIDIAAAIRALKEKEDMQ